MIFREKISAFRFFFRVIYNFGKEMVAAIVAIVGGNFVACFAFWAFLFGSFVSSSNFRSYDTGGDGDDGITDDHGDGRDKFACQSVWHNIAITYCCNRNHRPIDALGDIAEAVFFSFHHIHDGAEKDNDERESQKESSDFVNGGFDGLPQSGGFCRESSQFQDAEYSEQAEYPENYYVAGAGDEQTDISGDGRKKIDYSVEAEYIFQRSGMHPYSGNILNGENDGEKPFRSIEKSGRFYPKTLNAVEHQNDDTQNDCHQQDFVKNSSFLGVGLENNGIPPFS